MEEEQIPRPYKDLSVRMPPRQDGRPAETQIPLESGRRARFVPDGSSEVPFRRDSERPTISGSSFKGIYRNEDDENANQNHMTTTDPIGSASDGTGWEYVYARLEKRDREMIKGYSEDIDSLLIFAGLFSAVLTAFLLEVYTQLQPDNAQISVQLLSYISLQLQQISLHQAAPATADPLNSSFPGIL
ncbi:hypothetical protein PUNSTDRAFT_139252 [Punctularia strigosozonata HHB-11173 SS5]|uniref:DUF6535 domain-containing protein n=1 Tax=Punctularia strigosozonata (strain HHB-11173) TaxID=741275 RepID=R7S044_PUNST|nr:uncharacterized protein PUNSTDRAFT_139252 [Punctularia strigosozonata HHB-11173 SS5]EIN03720.1 hypothetical protein PUNSTDRAFT_139252 [Punctularia strigosozonata HHB-11173 SS5]